MSVEILSRYRGAIIHCNRCGRFPNSEHWKTSLTTGQVQVGAIREYAKSKGWIRGLRKTKWIPPGQTYRLPANQRHDICPACAPAERAEVKQREQLAKDRRAARHTKRKALTQPAATPP